MTDRRNERGEGRIGFLFAVALCAAAVFAGAKYIPVRIAAYNFHDVLRQEVRYAAVRDSVETVRRRILEQAEELSVPLDEQDLMVKKTASEVTVKAVYEQPIDFKITSYTYRFEAEEHAPLF